MWFLKWLIFFLFDKLTKKLLYRDVLRDLEIKKERWSRFQGNLSHFDDITLKYEEK